MADFTNSCATILPGFGAPAQRQKTVDNVENAGANALPTLTFSPGIRRGYWRLRSKSVNGATTTTAFKITASDGSTTVSIYSALGGDLGAAGVAFDTMRPFILDIVATTFIATVTTANNVSTWDFEVVGGN